jgi:hypothetical protein
MAEAAHTGPDDARRKQCDSDAQKSYTFLFWDNLCGACERRVSLSFRMEHDNNGTNKIMTYVISYLVVICSAGKTYSKHIVWV